MHDWYAVRLVLWYCIVQTKHVLVQADLSVGLQECLETVAASLEILLATGEFSLSLARLFGILATLAMLSTLSTLSAMAVAVAVLEQFVEITGQEYIVDDVDHAVASKGVGRESATHGSGPGKALNGSVEAEGTRELGGGEDAVGTANHRLAGGSDVATPDLCGLGHGGSALGLALLGKVGAGGGEVHGIVHTVAFEVFQRIGSRQDVELQDFENQLLVFE